ncbi:MAG: response regulator [Gammaproteobacteria bacterium]|nr:response regulator [Gammaproteobacteria bacterium]
MKTVFTTILLLVALGISASAPVTYAQHTQPPGSGGVDKYVKFDHLTTENGLSNDSVWGMAQDSYGFMWFGTFDGLNRYDGSDIKVFRHDPDDPHSLSGDAIRGMHVDQTGTLWIGTWGNGLNQFDRKTERFIRYRHDPDDPYSLSNDAIRTIYEDRAGTLWIGTMGGLDKLTLSEAAGFDRETKRFTHYKRDPTDPYSLSHNGVFAIYEDRAGVLWIGTDGGLNQFDPETERFVHYRHHPADPQSLSHNSVRSICEDGSGTLWVGTYGGLNRFDRATGHVIRYQHDPADPVSLSHNSVVLVYEDQAGILWVGTWGGLNQLDRETETFTHYQHNPADPHSLNADNVWLIYEDKEGMTWIATDGGGVNILDRGGKPFRHYRSIPGDPNSLGHNAVRALYEDRAGALWIGTNSGGLNKFAPSTSSGQAQAGQFTHYQHDPDDANSLRSNSIWAIYEDQTGLLWLGSYGAGLHKFERDAETFTQYRHNSDDPRSLSNDIIFALYEDHAKRLWIGTWGGGLNRLDLETEQFTRYQHDPADSGTLSHNQVTNIYEDSAGIFWIGTMGGLNQFDLESGTFTRYHHDPANPESLGHNAVTSIYEDSGGRLWIGMMGGGLDKFDREQERFIHYTVKDGLPGNTVFGILEDDDTEGGNLWLSTTWGLSRFNPRTGTFRNYEKSDGLQSNSFLAPNAYYKSRNGDLFFGGSNGFNAFYPERITENPHIPPVVITDFQLANKPVPIGGDSVLQQSILETEHLTLSYVDRVFSFEFAALNYRASEENRYRYTMEGFEEDWTEVDSARRFATYTNLDAGDYVFRVIGSNNDGVWNEEAAAIKITVTPPWWETIWFRGVMLVLVVSIVFGGFRWRVRAIENQRHQLEIQVNERTRELSARTAELNKSNTQLKTAKEAALEAQQRAEAAQRASEAAQRASEAAQRASEVANHAKSTFLANMSHELRTPLNAILGYAQILRRSKDLDADHLHRVGIIHRSGEHLLTLISDILDISKIEAGKMELLPITVHVPSFLDGIAGIIRARTEENGLDFTIATDTLPDGIRADEVRLRQVLLNLLSNAVKFTEQGGVTLRVSQLTPQPPLLQREGEQDLPSPLRRGAGDEVVLPSPLRRGAGGEVLLHFSISDTGVGVSADDLNRIFRPFEQVGGLKERAAGTGLGLSITQQLVSMMGGELHADSTPGQGSAFWFELSFPVVATTVKARQPDREITDYAGPRRTILVADDSPENRMVLRDMLELVGFEVILAENGREAVVKAHDIRPDLILMDLVMSVMTGIEAVQALRREPAFADVPIIAVSASVLESDRRKSQVAGCDAFLPKPVAAPALYALLKAHLHLTWTYMQAKEDTLPEPVTPDALCPPPPEELAILRDMALSGLMSDIKKRAAYIAALDERYRPFAETLRQLAKSFADEDILALVKHFMQQDNEK